MKKIVLMISTIIIIAMFILVACDTKTPEAIPLSNNETSETKENDESNKKEDVIDSNVNTGESTKTNNDQTIPSESTTENSKEETNNESQSSNEGNTSTDESKTKNEPEKKTGNVSNDGEYKDDEDGGWIYLG